LKYSLIDLTQVVFCAGRRAEKELTGILALFKHIFLDLAHFHFRPPGREIIISQIPQTP
jgi:hypothetical protein